MQAQLPHDCVLHGDCMQLLQSLPPKCVDLVFADPPYNLQLSGDLWRPNMSKVDAVTDEWDRFAAPGAAPEAAFACYDAFTAGWLAAVRRVMKDSAALWVIGTYHHIYRTGRILQDLGFWILNDVVWIKSNPVPQMRGVRFCNAHETLIWAAKSRSAKRVTFNYHGMKAGNENVQMRSDWHIPICSGSERLTIDGEKAHSTQKPEALLHRVIASTTRPGDLVLDPFCGTGTTAAVAKRLGRRYITMDRDAGYVELALKRAAAVTPVLDEAGAPPLDARKPRLPFVSLVEQGVVPAGSVLLLRPAGPYRAAAGRISGAPVAATVHEDGSLSVNGVRGSIHKVAARCLSLPAANGWDCWAVLTASGEAGRSIDELRQEALRSAAAER